MKLQIMSDLHIINWGNARGPAWWHDQFLPSIMTDADVLVLAGDIASLAHSELAWTRARLEEFRNMYRRTIYVPGNHEFYGTGIYEGTQALLALEKTVGIDVLVPGKVVEIGGHRFHGGTMWQPHYGRFYEAAQQISDSWCIDDFHTEASPCFDLLMEHLRKECRPGDIVVTHHAPSWGSLDQQWVGHPANRFFITPEAETLMIKTQPSLWVHGHVHSTWDYSVGPTRVVANPLGYPNEGVGFNPKLVIEVP